ncbi:hypothetical protein AB751O23_AD_00020 [Chlamydiales bacterium SCGC AB-751-O23]|nr:hypothetical protein AB751O23_AD_00020 [Chlamydiales bacterium SCGC AB-751-O23]
MKVTNTLLNLKLKILTLFKVLFQTINEILKKKFKKSRILPPTPPLNLFILFLIILAFSSLYELKLRLIPKKNILNVFKS